jgi:hypothetical protein
MSGVVVVRWLLASDFAILEAVGGEASVYAGRFPAGTNPPALSVMHIDGSDFTRVNRNESGRLVTERVQVSWITDNYKDILTLARLVPLAVPNVAGVVNGVNVDSISLEIEGPDLDDPGTSLFTRSRDFIVRYRV